MDSKEINCLGSSSRRRCRICLLGDEEAEKRIVSNICDCKGEAGNVHVECLATWINMSERDDCELCLKKMNVVRLPKYSNILSSMIVFVYLNRVGRLLLLMVVFGLFVYVSSIWYVDHLALKPKTVAEKIWALAVNFAIFLSVFIISYSPLICLYLWDLWNEWRKLQYHLEVQPYLVNV